MDRARSEQIQPRDPENSIGAFLRNFPIRGLGSVISLAVVNCQERNASETCSGVGCLSLQVRLLLAKTGAAAEQDDQQDRGHCQPWRRPISERLRISPSSRSSCLE